MVYIPDKPVKTFHCFLNTNNPHLDHVKEIGLKWPIFEIKSNGHSNGHFHFLKKCLEYDLVEFEQIFDIKEEEDSMNHKSYRRRQSNGNYFGSKNCLFGKPPPDLKEEYILDLEDLVPVSPKKKDQPD